jgi:hypothetical protein
MKAVFYIVAASLAFAPAARAESPSPGIPALFEKLLLSSSGGEADALRASRDLTLRYHELLRGLRGKRVTGLLDVVRRTSDSAVTAFLTQAAAAPQAPGLFRRIHAAMTSARDRAHTAVKSVLARLSPPPALTTFFSLLGDVMQEAFTLVTNIAAGKTPYANDTMHGIVTKHRMVLSAALGEFRGWAVKAGIDTVREYMFEAIILLTEGSIPATKEPVPES